MRKKESGGDEGGRRWKDERDLREDIRRLEGEETRERLNCRSL